MVAGSFFLLGFIFQILLIKELHLQSAEQDILMNIENHLPFHLHSEGKMPSSASSLAGDTKMLLRGDNVQLREKRNVFAEVPQRKPDELFPPPAAEPEVALKSSLVPIAPIHSPISPTREHAVTPHNFSSRYYRDIIGEVPQIVQSWRNAKLDWHDLLPKHM